MRASCRVSEVQQVQLMLRGLSNCVGVLGHEDCFVAVTVVLSIRLAGVSEVVEGFVRMKALLFLLLYHHDNDD